jgi:hypothetical protein
MSPNPVWVIEALTAVPKARIFGSVDEAIAAATERDVNQSSGVDRSRRIDRCQSSELDRYRSSAVDPTSQVQETNQSSPAGEPVKSNTDSISSLNLISSSLGVPAANADATQRATNIPVRGADAPKAVSATPMKDAVWQQGLDLLNDLYKGSIPDKELRQRLGKIYSQYGAGPLLNVLVSVEKTRPIDPFTYMTKILAGSKPQTRADYGKFGH